MPPALPPRWAALFAALLIVAAIGAGLALGTIARPAPTPVRLTPSPTVAPTATPLPTTDPALFSQPLASGCATEQSVWVVTNGGGLLRYDGEHWSQADGTLRSLTFATCDVFLLYAVGPAGAVLTADDRARRVAAVDVTTQDLTGVSSLPDGVLVVGTQGTVMRLSGGEWQPYARGIEEDLRAIVAFDGLSAWAVGSGGVSYRLEPAGWRPVVTGVEVTLRAVTGLSVGGVVAVGDGGTILVFTGVQWSRIDSGVETALRAVAIAGPTAWVVGDGGVVLAVVDSGYGGATPPRLTVRRVDIGTRCDLLSVFTRGTEVWIVGWDGTKGGVWRLRNDAVAERWGAC